MANLIKLVIVAMFTLVLITASFVFFTLEYNVSSSAHFGVTGVAEMSIEQGRIQISDVVNLDKEEFQKLYIYQFLQNSQIDTDYNFKFHFYNRASNSNCITNCDGVQVQIQYYSYIINESVTKTYNYVIVKKTDI